MAGESDDLLTELLNRLTQLESVNASLKQANAELRNGRAQYEEANVGLSQTNRELSGANDELRASNALLQATNDELRESDAVLRGLIEELRDTVAVLRESNAELQEANSELRATNSDLRQLVSVVVDETARREQQDDATALVGQAQPLQPPVQVFQEHEVLQGPQQQILQQPQQLVPQVVINSHVLQPPQQLELQQERERQQQQQPQQLPEQQRQQQLQELDQVMLLVEQGEELLGAVGPRREEAVDERAINYQALMELETGDLVPNLQPFECPVCFVPCAVMEGIVLRDCLHSFCRACLENTVQYSEEAAVKCPFRDDEYACDSVLQQREVKALVPSDVYEQHLARSLALVEVRTGNAFHCKTPDCGGWCVFEDDVNEFPCPVCNHANCLTCQAIHEGKNCKQYQDQLKLMARTNEEAKKTQEAIEKMLQSGEAITCPACRIVIKKKGGCDFLQCSMCRTEICWVTRGARWGPNGRGDTSGGCRCRLNGMKCHPQCRNCH